MIGILNGDIIGSRNLINQDLWLDPLKTLFNRWGMSPQTWEIIWGDTFQIQISSPADTLHAALQIKSLIKGLRINDNFKTNSELDVRISIGIGDKTFTAPRISESNGQAFILAGQKFERLKKEKTRLAIKTPWDDFDKEMNVYFRLLSVIMDSWTVQSAELMAIVLNNKNLTQEEIGRLLEIKQNSVSGRWARSHVDEVLEFENIFRKKVSQLIT